MSDRYLCKAKRKDNEEWSEGYYAYIDGVHYIYTGELCNGGLYVVAERFEVDPETLCQYTGLHDRTKWEELSEKEQQKFLSEWNYEKDRKNQKEDWNGKKIWENDIVKFKHGGEFSENGIYFRNYVVEFINTFVSYGLRLRNKSIHFPFKQATASMHDAEIIGNIFDNPELLEGGAE